MSHSLKQQTIDYYDKHAQSYAQYVDEHYSTEQISSFLGLLPDNPKVLDAGCGSGRDVFFMHTAGAQVTGIDLSQSMISYASSKYPDLKFVHGDILQMPFPNDSYDGIWAHGVLFHLETLEEVKAAFSEFDRVLKNGGILHVLVKLQKDSQKVKVFSDNPHGDSRVYRFFHKEELELLLKESGFESVISETYEENERNPKGRHDVTWLHVLARKIN